jgi:hypothetical protein
MVSIAVSIEMSATYIYIHNFHSKCGYQLRSIQHCLVYFQCYQFDIAEMGPIRMILNLKYASSFTSLLHAIYLCCIYNWNIYVRAQWNNVTCLHILIHKKYRITRFFHHRHCCIKKGCVIKISLTNGSAPPTSTIVFKNSKKRFWKEHLFVQIFQLWEAVFDPLATFFELHPKYCSCWSQTSTLYYILISINVIMLLIIS